MKGLKILNLATPGNQKIRDHSISVFKTKGIDNVD